MEIIVVAQSLSHVWLFATPWTVTCEASLLSFTISWSLLKLISIESVSQVSHPTILTSVRDNPSRRKWKPHLQPFPQNCIPENMLDIGFSHISQSFCWTFVPGSHSFCWTFVPGSHGCETSGGPCPVVGEGSCSYPIGHKFDLGLPNSFLIHLNESILRWHTC